MSWAPSPGPRVCSLFLPLEGKGRGQSHPGPLRPLLLFLRLALSMFKLLPPVGLGVQARLNPLLSEPCYGVVSGLLLGAVKALRIAPSTVPAGAGLGGARR